MFFPPATVDGRDTGLRFTDILFGFVIFQLFQRLQHAGSLPWFARWELIAATTLVLGSWIGFRRSLNRSDYQPKFFNLPFFRFVLDQVMVLLYFRIAVLSPINPNTIVDPSTLAHNTALTLLLIFALYAAWDILGIWMAYARERESGKKTWKYREITRDGEKTDTRALPNWKGTAITIGGLVAFASLYGWTQGRTLDVRDAEIAFVVATILLLAYRMAKEIRTSLTTRVAADDSSGVTPAEAAAVAIKAAGEAADAAKAAAEAAAAVTAAVMAAADAAAAAAAGA